MEKQKIGQISTLSKKRISLQDKFFKMNNDLKIIQSEIKRIDVERDERMKSLSLEECCWFATLDFVSVNEEIALVSFSWKKNEPKRAFLVWKEKETGNDGSISISVGKDVRKNFSSVCLCGYNPNFTGGGCGYTEDAFSIVEQTAKVASENGIKRIFARTKKDLFKSGKVEFLEIMNFASVESVVKKYGKPGRDMYIKFFNCP
jgi:hypothetical protein